MSKSKAPKEPILVSFETHEYWDKAQEIIEKAGVYASAKKLQANLEDEATRWKVKRVLTRYYEGDFRLLKDSVHHKRRDLMKAIGEFNILAANNGKHEITKPDSLINLLLDKERRRKYKSFIEKHRKKNEIIDLQKVEMEFRKWKVEYEKKKK